MKAICPKCQGKIDHAQIESMPLHSHGRMHWKGCAFLCPDCHTILGVGIDPEEIISKEERKVLRDHDRVKIRL